jgi:hypothetical protein
LAASGGFYEMYFGARENRMDTTECTEEIGAALDRAVRKFAQLLLEDDMELSIADFIRLMQLRKEYGGARRPALTVKWVDEWGSQIQTEE